MICETKLSTLNGSSKRAFSLERYWNKAKSSSFSTASTAVKFCVVELLKRSYGTTMTDVRGEVKLGDWLGAFVGKIVGQSENYDVKLN